MKRKICLYVILAFTCLACHVTKRMYYFSTVAFYLVPGPEPASLMKIFLAATYLQNPPDFSACINNLRQIDGAKQQWAMDHGITNDAPVTWEDIRPYFRNTGSQKQQLWCPRGGVYRLGTLAHPPTCSVKGHAMPD